MKATLDHLAQLSAGYDRLIFDYILLGVELFGEASYAVHAEKHYTDSTYEWNHSIKTPYSYGVALKLGYRVDNSDIFYLRPTYQMTKYKRQTETSTNDTVGPDATVSVGGVGAGIGYAKMLTPFTALRFEIAHVNYGQAKAPTADWEHNMRENTFTIGYSHHFHRFNATSARLTSPDPQFGIYVGLGGGLSSYRGDMLYTLTLNNAKQYHLMNGGTGYLAVAHLGYGNMFSKRTYIGFEFQNIYNTANSQEIIGGDNTVSMKESQGNRLSILPGYLMENHSLLMGQFGLTYTNFERPSPVLTNTDAGPRGDQGPEFSKWKTGVVVGVGYQTALTDNFSIRGMYSHSFYDRIRLTEYDTSGAEQKYYDWIMQSAHLSISVNYRVI